MTLLRVSAKCGSPCGKINLSMLVDDIDLEDGRYVLSFRERMSAPLGTDADGVLVLGAARAEIRKTGVGPYEVTIESPNTADYVAIYREVQKRLGLPVIEIDYPVNRVPPSEQSFVRGISNDIRRLAQSLLAGAMSIRRNGAKAIFNN